MVNEKEVYDERLNENREQRAERASRGGHIHVDVVGAECLGWPIRRLGGVREIKRAHMIRWTETYI